jgi:hypothetical protein
MHEEAQGLDKLYKSALFIVLYACLVASTLSTVGIGISAICGKMILISVVPMLLVISN